MINYKELTKSLLATVFILLGVSLLFFVLFKLKSILVYIVVSVVVSLLCRPMYQLGFKLTKSSGFSAIFSLTIFFGLFALFFLLMVPLIRQQAENLSLLDTHLIREKAMSQLNFFNAYLLQMDIHFLDDYLKSGKGFDLQLSKISHYLNKTLGMVLSFTMDVFSVMFISFFFVKDSELFTKMIKSIVPDSKESKAERALDSIEHLLVRYFFGLLLQVLVMFVLYLIILKVFSIQDSVVIALICALLNIIPYIGPLIGMFVFTFLASSSLFSSGIPMNDAFVQKIIYLVVGYLIAQLIDNFVNQPIIYSKSVKSHPLEIFIVILCFGVLFGFVGILVAVPAYTAIKVIAKEFLWEFKLVKSITKDL